MLFEMAALYICARILVESYRENKQRRRETSQNPRKPKKLALKLEVLFSLLRGIRGQRGKKLGHVAHDVSHAGDGRRGAILPDRGDQLGVARAHRPNENEMSCRE